ncbi:NADP-dependent malic enzyme [Chloropicon primus]|uniref:Malic enzyme n=2 Tax=Chloropicon primus TaxID=1764295 RepID=A0A5B8MR11_9CHLO|nr:NADP-dependent malic enzyme [Chloropicon primus]UPR01285.1 NADP-dependent malic enzyme [Chloropicon primus]|eukprot:QDZ22065.1 NADP-dependent malic enzyme [Chloropicon primus]
MVQAGGGFTTRSRVARVTHYNAVRLGRQPGRNHRRGARITVRRALYEPEQRTTRGERNDDKRDGAGARAKGQNRVPHVREGFIERKDKENGILAPSDGGLLRKTKRRTRFCAEAPFPYQETDLYGDEMVASEDVEKVFQGAEAGIDKYLALRALHAKDPRGYYRLLVEHTEEVLPFIYTPTVGEACQKYSKLNIQTTGLYLSLADRGRILDKLRSWKHGDKVSAIVVTDGERILGLGDLGAGGMGISEGKIQLYTAAAGVNPDSCLPICLDVGTNRESLLEDPDYIGMRQKRPTGIPYYSFLDEFIQALKAWRPHLLLQFEDFGNHTAFVLLNKYRNQLCCFNDDIQGTAAITLAGILGALRLKSGGLTDQKILFHGAGEAGVGCGELIALALNVWHGVPLPEARKRILFMDSKGLVCKQRVAKLQDHKIPFAHDLDYAPDLLTAVKLHKPTVLVGVSTQKGAFSEEVIRAMCDNCNRPVIFPLSNPTSKSECTYQEAFEASEGKVIFASGSPFDPLTMRDGQTFYPAQANNAYIFPAVGHAAILCKAKCIPDEVFLEAAKCLSGLSSDRDLVKGKLFPSFSEIREVSATITAHLCKYICEQGLGEAPEGLEGSDFSAWLSYAREQMYEVRG